MAPAELEALLLTHPQITDAAVIGVPNERLGEAPRAFVVKKGDAELAESDIQEFVAAKVRQGLPLVEYKCLCDMIRWQSTSIWLEEWASLKPSQSLLRERS